jgi:hypothetical protein
MREHAASVSRSKNLSKVVEEKKEADEKAKWFDEKR